MTWSNPRTWLAGEDPAASVYNAHIRDNFKAIGDSWTSYNPTWAVVSGTNPVIGNGTKTGAYIQAGKLIMFRVSITAGSTTTWGTGIYTFSYPPFAPLDSGANGNPGITGFVFDSSPAKPYGGFGVGQSGTIFRLVMANADSYFSNAFPITPATGDKINIAGTYEAA